MKFTLLGMAAILGVAAVMFLALLIAKQESDRTAAENNALWLEHGCKHRTRSFR